MKKDKSNLPVVNNFRTKFRKAIFIFLSSLRIASSIQPTLDASAKTNTYETMDKNDRKSNREKFIQDLSIKKNNEKIINQIIEDRGLEFSIETSKGDKVKEILIKTLNKIDENFDRNAKKKGKMAFTKEKFKNDYISLISNLDDIVCVGKDTKENQYTQYYKERGFALPAAIYFKGDIVNSLGTIHENNILMKEDRDNIEYILIHELTHKRQGKTNNNRYINHKNVFAMLYEGHSNNMAEYVRDTKLDDREFTITNVSMTNYYISSKIYNKLSYLVGEIQMDEYMQKTNEKTLRDFLKEKLDDKYGKGTGQNLYKYVTNLSFFSRFTIDLKPEKIEGLYEKISKRNESVQQEIEKKGQSDELSSILDVNNNFKAMLDKIYNKDTKTINKKAYKNEKNKQLKGIEMLCLDCISKDIENINNKNDAIDYVQLWDYYRNRCSISKYYEVGEEAPVLSENFDKLKEVQKNLYNKCKQYKALNISDKEIFDKLIESQLYNVSNATISYNKNETELTISDEYIVNKFEVETKKDGNKKYSIITEYENDKGTVKGKKILATKELDKERE